MTKILTPFILVLLMSSCSSIQPITTRKKSLTERERILEYYRSLREMDQNSQNSKRYIKSKKVTYVPKKPRRPKIKMVDIKEQRIEIEQNLVYYCMENRKSSRFSDDSPCESYAQDIYSQCQDDFIDGDARLTRCVKSRLK